jgi:hypothetical protein
MQTVMRFWGLLFLCGLSAFSWADPLLNYQGKQELILFEAAKNQTPEPIRQSAQLDLQGRLHRMRTADVGGLDKFLAKAQLTWDTQQQSVVANARDFIWSADFSQVTQGWAGQGNQYVWSGLLGQHVPLNLNLSTAIAKQPFQLSDYDELWVDYTSTPSVKQCGMQLEFQGLLHSQDKKNLPKTVLWHTGHNFDLKVLGRLDASNAAVKERDYSYLLERFLGLAPDENWRFVQNQKNTVFQRRMHLKLDNAHNLEIAFAAGTVVERVNLKVSLKDGHGVGELLEFSGLFPVATSPDGHPVVKLDLRNALAQRFPREWEENSKEVGTNSFYLKEVFLFFPGDAQTVTESKPVLRLTLLGKETGQEFPTLTSQVKSVNSFRQRFSVDIRNFANIGHVDLTKANLRLYPPEDTASCMVRINDIRAVSYNNSQVPAFAENLEGWVRSRGGPFVRLLPEQGQVEQPRIVNFLPLSTFSLVGDAKLKTQKYPLSGSREGALQIKPIGTNAPTPFHVLTKAGKDVALKNKLISINNGATLAFQGMEPTVSRDGDNLVLKGDSDALEITWPMATRLFENTWFYFNVIQGVEQIAYVSLTLEFADGHQISSRIEPNRPFRIDSHGAQLSKLSLSLAFKTKPFRIKLRELALFSPKIATYGEARTLALPLAMNAKPKPTITKGAQIFLESGPGYATGLIRNEPVRFLTLLDNQLDLVQGINLGFRFPPQLADEGKCPLMMQLNWTNGQTLRQFCPANMEGSIFLPLARLLGPENEGRNLGALKSIDWVVAASGSHVGGGKGAFSLSFSVDGWAMLSAMDQVRLSPVIRAGKEEVYADMPKLKNDFSDSYSKRFWLPLENAAFENIAAMRSEILPVNHPLFKLNKVVAEPKQPIDMARWLTLLDPPAPNSPPDWPKLLLWVSIMAFLWAAWKKGWWSIGGLSRIFLVTGEFLLGMARITIQWQAKRHTLLLAVWVALTMLLYGIGVILKMGNGENYFFTFGGIAMVMVVREIFLTVEPLFRKAFPYIANSVYGGAGSMYFSCALVLLFGTATMLSLKLEPIAEQLAVVVYYCLVLGTVLEIAALRRNQNNNSAEKAISTTSHD